MARFLPPPGRGPASFTALQIARCGALGHAGVPSPPSPASSSVSPARAPPEDAGSPWPSRSPAISRVPTLSIAPAGSSPPMSPCIRSTPTRCLSSISTRSWRSSAPRLPDTRYRRPQASRWPIQSPLRVGCPRAQPPPGPARARPRSPGARLPHGAQAGLSAGHARRFVIGTVNTDNKGSPVSSACSTRRPVEAVQGPGRRPVEPVRLSLDVGVQYGLWPRNSSRPVALLRLRRPRAGARRQLGGGPRCGPLPRSIPRAPPIGSTPRRVDRLVGGTFELGSIFKALTVAHGARTGQLRSRARLDVRQPLTVGRVHDQGPASAGPAAAGARCVPALLQRRCGTCCAGASAPSASARSWASLGLTEPMRAEAGPVADAAAPQALGADRDRDDRLWPRAVAGAAAVRCRHGGPRQWRRVGYAYSHCPIRRRGRRLRVVSRPPAPSCARSCASTSRTRTARPSCGGRRAIASAARLARPRCRAAAATRRGRHLLVRRRLPDGCAALRGDGDAVRASGPAKRVAITSRPASYPAFLK